MSVFNKDQFKGKKVTVMGLGLLGRGLGDARFLAECGAEVLVTDLKTKEQLASSLEQLKNYTNISYVLGEHRLEDFRHCDFVLMAAGVHLDSPYIAEARKNNIPVEMDASLFAKHTDAILIGITGTRGKSTVTHAIYEILQTYYKNGKVFLGGNVRGMATLPLLNEAKKGDVVVMELDSWQLQGFGESRIAPHISIFTNFLPDHLNYYLKTGLDEAGAMKLYFHDKAQIFKYQKKGDYFIAHSQVIQRIKEYGQNFDTTMIVADKGNLPKEANLKIPGEHNKENMALVYEALRVFGLAESDILAGLENFAGVPGRLEMVREYNGIKIYNDTTSTTPIALIVALRSLGADKSIVLIMGGADKTLDMTEIYPELIKYCKAIILLPGTGTDRIQSTIEQAVGAQIITTVSTLAEAVAIALAKAQSGDTIVMSPGFASFGLFKNEYDRGDQFDAIVKSL